MGDEVKIEETRTLATGEKGEAVETGPEGGNGETEAATEEPASDEPGGDDEE